MSNIVGLDLNIDNNYLEECIRQTVVMGISEALNGKNEIVSQIVHDLLRMKVNERGEVSRYGSDNKYTLLEYLVKKNLSDVISNELMEEVEKARPMIAAKLRECILEEATMGDLVASFVDSFRASSRYRWNTSMTVNFTRADD